MNLAEQYLKTLDIPFGTLSERNRIILLMELGKSFATTKSPAPIGYRQSDDMMVFGFYDGSFLITLKNSTEVYVEDWTQYYRQYNPT